MGMGFIENPWNTKMFCVRCPHWKTFYNFHCYPKYIYNENYKWFSGHCSLIGDSLNTHRLGVITFRSAFRGLMG